MHCGKTKKYFLKCAPDQFDFNKTLPEPIISLSLIKEILYSFSLSYLRQGPKNCNLSE